MGTTSFSTSLFPAGPLPRPDAAARPVPRALVLGGGGSTGNAWLVGVVAGLLDAGVDVTDADLVVGTSAGATAAFQITGGNPSELLAAALVPPPSCAGRSPSAPVSGQLDRLSALIAASNGSADLRRRIGAAAGEPDAATQERWRATVATRLPQQGWPECEVWITAVDADTGRPLVIARSSAVPPADAVAASTANGFGVGPYRISDRRLLDGGYRRNENADLAAGYGRVLVLSPFGGRSLHPDQWGTALAVQVDELMAGGSEVLVVSPEAGAEHLFGANAMDLSLRPAAAGAGAEQGRALAATLARFWG